MLTAPDAAASAVVSHFGRLDSGVLVVVLAGGVAWYSVVGGLLPRPALALMRAAQRGDAADMRRLDANFASLWALFKRHGSVRVVYAAANLMGLTDKQPPRPILPLEAGDRAQTERALAEVGA